MPVSDSQASSTGYFIPSDSRTEVSAIPSIIRQNARMASNTPWYAVAMATGYTVLRSEDSPMFRITQLGLQLRGEVTVAGAKAMDSTIFSINYTAYRPAAGTPNRRFMMPSMGPGANGTYSALAYQAEIRADGRVTTRQPLADGNIINFNTLIPYLD